MPRHRIPDRRAHLLSAARELTLEQGWAATSVSAIAVRAGIGKGAVYLEFPTKAAILDALIAESMRGLIGEVHRRVLEAEDLVDLPAIYTYAVDALLADPLMRAFYLGDEGVLGEHAREVDDDRYRRRFDWLGDYVAALQSAGVIDPRIDRFPLMRMLSVFTIGLTHAPGSLEPATDEQLRDTVDLFAHLVGRGLATDLPIDADAVRRAQLDLLDHLGAQLDHLQSEPPKET